MAITFKEVNKHQLSIGKMTILLSVDYTGKRFGNWIISS